MAEELRALADQAEQLLGSFRDVGGLTGLSLPTRQTAQFKGICTEAQSIIGEHLGAATGFSLSIGMAANRLYDGPSYSDVEDAAEQMRAAARTIKRRGKSPSAAAMLKPSRNYVDPSRIASLSVIQSSAHDFKRLIALCREINIAAENDCHLATAMLLRAIIDHIPPIFGFKSFVEVANNYPCGQSFKHILNVLQTTSRKIADMHLHGPIRQQEDVPTAVQVDFSQQLDAVLGEVIRKAMA